MLYKANWIQLFDDQEYLNFCNTFFLQCLPWFFIYIFSPRNTNNMSILTIYLITGRVYNSIYYFASVSNSIVMLNYSLCSTGITFLDQLYLLVFDRFFLASGTMKKGQNTPVLKGLYATYICEKHLLCFVLNNTNFAIRAADIG